MRRNGITIILSLLAVWSAAGREAAAQSAGATSSGNWNDPTIWTTGTVPGSSSTVFIGSTYPTGSAATATVTLTQAQSADNVWLGYGSGTSGTLNLGSNALTVSQLSLGAVSGGSGTGTIQEASGGSFTAGNVEVWGGNSLTFGANDQTSDLHLGDSSTATTTAAGNITGTVSVVSGSSLHLGADLNLTGSDVVNLNVDGLGSVLDMGGHAITAPDISLATDGTGPVTVLNQGNITAGELEVGSGMTYNLLAGDRVNYLYLGGGSSTLNGSVTTLYLNSAASASTIAGTPMTMREVELAGSTLTLHGGDVISGTLSLSSNSLLTVQETSGTGLTLGGINSSLSLSSHMDLNFNATGWDFRWQDPSGGGNWISTIDGLINSGALVINLPAGGTYQVLDQGGYTYVDGFVTASVSEPSSVVLAAMAIGGVAIGRRWQRSRPRR